MDQNTINRINELARKSKGEGLTPEEKIGRASCRERVSSPV